MLFGACWFVIENDWVEITECDNNHSTQFIIDILDSFIPLDAEISIKNHMGII